MKASSAPFRSLLLLVLLGLALAGGWWLFSRKTAPEALKNNLAEKAVNLAKERGVTSFDGSRLDAKGNPLEEAVGLALQGINLFQGEKGLELWRLKASWAHLSKDGDEINVDKPHVVYAMGDTGLPTRAAAAEEPEQLTDQNAGQSTDFPDFGDADVLDVTALKGRVTDHQRHLMLWDDVVITRFGDTLTGPRMDYDSTTRTMTFPDGARLESERGSGTAAILHWDLANNIITGQNGVNVLLKPRPQTAETLSQETTNPDGQTVKTKKTAPALVPSPGPRSASASGKAAVNATAPQKDAKAAPKSKSQNTKVKNGHKTQKKSQATPPRTAKASKRSEKSQGSGAGSKTLPVGKP